MVRQLKILIISLLIGVNSFASNNLCGAVPEKLNDGPYIVRSNNGFKARWVQNGSFRRSNVTPENFPELRKKFNLLFDYNDLAETYLHSPDYRQNYTGVDSISTISDIHGEFGFYADLIKSMGIVDRHLNWNFGTGHLVVLGDIFDRGDKVTEVLWHLYGLEKQAAKDGGRVHVLLGNHELMVLGKDIKHSHEKYFRVEELLMTKYYDLYSEESVLGKWLRSKPVMVTINDILFVHGGISIDMVRRDLKVELVNRMFTESILGKDKKIINENEGMKFLCNSDGPLWYRGYFDDTKFCETKIDSIQAFYAVKHIVVGHTQCDIINTLFDTKVLGIDTGIMNELASEMLIYKKGSFYRGLVNGDRIKL